MTKKTNRNSRTQDRGGLPKASPITKALIVWHPKAVVELETQVPDKQTRKRVHSAVDILVQSGGKGAFPLQSAVKDGDGLRELRCGSGRIPWRPIFGQVDGTQLFVIWAFGPEAQVDGPGFDAAVQRAKDRRTAARST